MMTISDLTAEKCNKKRSCKHCKRVQIAHECVHALSFHYSAVDTVCIMAMIYIESCFDPLQ